MPRPIVPAPITAMVFTSIASPRKKVLNTENTEAQRSRRKNHNGVYVHRFASQESASTQRTQRHRDHGERTTMVFTSIASPRKKVLQHREHRGTEITEKEPQWCSRPSLRLARKCFNTENTEAQRSRRKNHNGVYVHRFASQESASTQRTQRHRDHGERTTMVFTSIASPRKKVLQHREHRGTEITEKEPQWCLRPSLRLARKCFNTENTEAQRSRRKNHNGVYVHRFASQESASTQRTQRHRDHGERTTEGSSLLPFAFCLLPFAFYLLPFAFYLASLLPCPVNTPAQRARRSSPWPRRAPGRRSHADAGPPAAPAPAPAGPRRAQTESRSRPGDGALR